MPILKFSLPKPIKKREPQPKKIVLEKDVVADVAANDKGFLVAKIVRNYNTEIYKFTANSTKTKNKRVLYARRLDKYGHRIQWIRDPDNRFEISNKFYSPLAPGLKVRGSIIKDEFGNVLFNVVSVWNEMNINSVSKAIKDWKRYIDGIKNGNY